MNYFLDEGLTPNYNQDGVLQVSSVFAFALSQGIAISDIPLENIQDDYFDMDLEDECLGDDYEDL